jgi:hypothetical protein
MMLEKNSPHAQGDKESLLNNVRLKTDQRSVAITLNDITDL